MSRSYAHAKIASLVALGFLTLGSGLASAQTHKKVDMRAMQAHSTWTFTAPACVAANGAQIWGGFAGPDDQVDVRTGGICGRN